MTFLKSKLIAIIFLTVFVIAFLFRILPVLNYNFVFTMDQARDMLDIREIAVGHHPLLIGPTTSITGVFLGPFYYYFNLLPFLAGQGDPSFLVYWNILWYMIAGAALLLILYKSNKSLALITSIIFLMSPQFYYSSWFFWNANPMPYITTFFFLSLFTYLQNPSKKTSFLAGLISGLSMQFESAFAILFFPYLLISSFYKKISYKKLISSLGGFAITLFPQVFFEIRHQFVMTKTLISELTGKSAILGDKLTFPETLQSHIKIFSDFTIGPLIMDKNLSYLILALSLIFLILRFKSLSSQVKDFFILSLGFILFSFIFYTFYHYPLKGWYLLGLRVPLIFIISLFLNEIFVFKNNLAKIAVVLIIGFCFYNTSSNLLGFIPKDANYRSVDKSNFRNEVEAIDWVYQKANGQGFKAYNYIPSVYDFPYQYLYWWYGTKKYGYQPEVLTYKDNVPEYINNNERYLTKKKPAGSDPLTFLIYEEDTERVERLYAWLGDFTKLCPVEKVDYRWGTTVELRKTCRAN